MYKRIFAVVVLLVMVSLPACTEGGYINPTGPNIPPPSGGVYQTAPFTENLMNGNSATMMIAGLAAETRPARGSTVTPSTNCADPSASCFEADVILDFVPGTDPAVQYNPNLVATMEVCLSIDGVNPVGSCLGFGVKRSSPQQVVHLGPWKMQPPYAQYFLIRGQHGPGGTGNSQYASDLAGAGAMTIAIGFH